MYADKLVKAYVIKAAKIDRTVRPAGIDIY
jgi:hypothetical protein